ncbi:MAG: hypothetical protein LBT05_04870 [Planctomycetaceae bacterium]|jgi:ribosomal protein S10|nr:hypothetical protein [Planctomycetaceae bacterium]
MKMIIVDPEKMKAVVQITPTTKRNGARNKSPRRKPTRPASINVMTRTNQKKK